MSIGTDFRTIHKVSMKDISRNYFLRGTVVIAFIVCLSMLFWGGSVTEKKRWMAYAVLLLISNFAMPLIYYIRYSDKNKRIIKTVIYVKMSNTVLYQYLIGLYHVIFFSAAYGVAVLLLSILESVHMFDIYLLLSVICVQCIVNGICILCLSIFDRYYIGLIVYMSLCVFFLTSNSVALGFLFPLNYESNSMMYFAGKMIEIFLVGLGNVIMIKKKLL